MKTNLTIIILIMVFLSPEKQVFGQSILWASQIGSNDYDGGTNAIIDNQNNLYFPGIFLGSACYFNTDTLYRLGYNDAFLAKYDQLGNEEWILQFGGNNVGPNTETIRICYDSVANYLYIFGTFSGLVTFGNYQFHCNSDLILAKYTTDGTCIWATKSGSDGIDQPSGIEVDRDGNIYVCGEAEDTIYFVSDPVPPGGFIAKFDTSGDNIWAKNIIPYANDVISAIKMTGIRIFDSTLLVSGSMEVDDLIKIDTITINHPGYVSCIVAFFTHEGDIVKIEEGISPATEMYSNLSIDKDGDIFITGLYFDSITFGTSVLYATSQEMEMFLVKYDYAGVIQWIRKAGSDKSEGDRVFTDANGYTYVSGQFSGNAFFDGANLTATSPADMFLARYAPDGTCLGAFNFPYGSGWSVTEDKMQNPIVTFLFNPTTTLGNSTFISHGLNDILIFKTDPIASVKELTGGPSYQLLIYANPTTGKCNITMPDEIKNDDHLVLYIYDSNGRLIQKANIERTSETYRLDIQAQAAGIYQAVLTNGSKSYSGKIVFTGN